MNFSKQPCYDILEATCVTRIGENAVIGQLSVGWFAISTAITPINSIEYYHQIVHTIRIGPLNFVQFCVNEVLDSVSYTIYPFFLFFSFRYESYGSTF